MVRIVPRPLRGVWSSRNRYLRILRTCLYRSRCYKCGLLGLQPIPRRDEAIRITDLRELTISDRNRTDHALKSARPDWPTRREYDYRKHSDLGRAEWIQGGVTCGVFHPNGPRFSYTTPELMGDLWPQALNDGAAVIRVPDLTAPLGSRIVAVVTTFLEPLVKPHDCNRYRKYRPGRSPAEHVNERRERLRTLFTAIGVAGAVLGGVAALIKWLF